MQFGGRGTARFQPRPARRRAPRALSLRRAALPAGAVGRSSAGRRRRATVAARLPPRGRRRPALDVRPAAARAAPVAVASAPCWRYAGRPARRCPCSRGARPSRCWPRPTSAAPRLVIVATSTHRGASCCNDRWPRLLRPRSGPCGLGVAVAGATGRASGASTRRLGAVQLRADRRACSWASPRRPTWRCSSPRPTTTRPAWPSRWRCSTLGTAAQLLVQVLRAGRHQARGATSRRIDGVLLTQPCGDEPASWSAGHPQLRAHMAPRRWARGGGGGRRADARATTRARGRRHARARLTAWMDAALDALGTVDTLDAELAPPHAPRVAVCVTPL